MKALISGIAAFVSNARIVYPSEKLSIYRDAEDNIVLECCYAAKAKLTKHEIKAKDLRKRF